MTTAVNAVNPAERKTVEQVSTRLLGSIFFQERIFLEFVIDGDYGTGIQ